MRISIHACLCPCLYCYRVCVADSDTADAASSRVGRMAEGGKDCGNPFAFGFVSKMLANQGEPVAGLERTILISSVLWMDLLRLTLSAFGFTLERWRKKPCPENVEIENLGVDVRALQRNRLGSNPLAPAFPPTTINLFFVFGVYRKPVGCCCSWWRTSSSALKPRNSTRYPNRTLSSAPSLSYFSHSLSIGTGSPEPRHGPRVQSTVPN